MTRSLLSRMLGRDLGEVIERRAGMVTEGASTQHPTAAAVSTRDSSHRIGAALDVHLAEFKAMRDEQLKRLEFQQQITQYSLALLAAVGAAAGFFSGAVSMAIGLAPGPTGLAVPRTVSATFSMLFSALGIKSIEQELMIAMVGWYIADRGSLIDRVNELISGPSADRAEHQYVVLQWETFRAEKTARGLQPLSHWLTALGRHALTFVPAAVLMVAQFTQPSVSPSAGWVVQALEWVVVVLSCVLFSALFVLAVVSARLYRRIFAARHRRALGVDEAPH